ncbi:MAG: hypothetical protein ACLTBR_03045 [Anaerostipes sp.]|uniref:hypothetical protein n=1 Tax=Anaerostipes sp. TaxID=1872530 RepID=UPI0039948139
MVFNKHCIIFTNDFDDGNHRLQEIIQDKEDHGNSIVKRACLRASNGGYVLFDDGELWEVIRPTKYARGYRPVKCHIDSRTVTLLQYEYILGCIFHLKDEEITYYNKD